jgi:hypothetical protein
MLMPVHVALHLRHHSVHALCNQPHACCWCSPPCASYSTGCLLGLPPVPASADTYPEHLSNKGYNAISITSASNCWVRDVSSRRHAAPAELALWRLWHYMHYTVVAHACPATTLPPHLRAATTCPLTFTPCPALVLHLYCRLRLSTLTWASQ